MPQMDLNRARKEMVKRGFDGLIAMTAPNFYYTTGFMPPLPGRPGFCVISTDPTVEPTMLFATFNEKVAKHISSQKEVRTYPIWIEIVEMQDIIENKIERQEKPAQFDFKEIYNRLAKILKDKGLQGKTIGIEKDSYMPKAYSFLEKSNPKTKFVDAEALFWDLRSIKTPEEIQILKSALQITEMGLKAMVEGKVEGVTIGELYYRYKMGVMQGLNKENAMGFEMSRAMISAGDHFASVRKQDYKISKGQSIYFDGGITLQGYLSDMGRTLVVGKPNDLQKKIFKALKAGYDAALERLGPGVRMREIFKIAVEATRKSGLSWYTRGHMGHAVGVAPGAEQPPFISATEERVFEPGMVICLESPLYVSELGGFQVEDEIVITKNGIEVLNAFPRDMVEVS